MMVGCRGVRCHVWLSVTCMFVLSKLSDIFVSYGFNFSAVGRELSV